MLIEGNIKYRGIKNIREIENGIVKEKEDMGLVNTNIVKDERIGSIIIL